MFIDRSNNVKNNLVSVITIVTVSAVCVAFRDFLDYRFTGYILLMTVSVLTIFLTIRAIILVVFLCVLILNFFFIEPYYTFHIYSAEQAMLLIVFFIVALVNGVLTQRLRKAQQAAQKLELKWNTAKLYDTLLDSLSHELRTPTATIMGAIGMMQDKERPVNEENKENLLAEMEKASHRLNHQVENLLNMSRLESGHIRPKMDWCDIVELVYKVLDSLAEELAHHKVAVNKNEYMPLFKLDYGLTEQVLYNLLFNAAQYSPPGSEIKLPLNTGRILFSNFGTTHGSHVLLRLKTMVKDSLKPILLMRLKNSSGLTTV